MAIKTQKINPAFMWLPTDVALKLENMRHPNTPLVVAEIQTYYKSLSPEKQKELEAGAKTADNEISKAFLQSIGKSRIRR